MALISLAQVRAQGLAAQVAADDRVTAAIDLAQQYIELATGRWFEPVTFTENAPLILDGTGSDALRLPVPILQLDKVIEGQADLAFGDLAWDAHDGTNRPDRRRMPKLFKKAMASPGVVYSTDARAAYLRGRWARLRRNVALVGVFGFIDGLYRGAWSGSTAYARGDVVMRNGQSYTATASNINHDPAAETNETRWRFGCAPPLITKTALRLVNREHLPVCDPADLDAHARGAKKSETVAGWSYSLGGLVASAGLTGIPVIDDVLAAYRVLGGGHTGAYRG